MDPAEVILSWVAGFDAQAVLLTMCFKSRSSGRLLTAADVMGQCCMRQCGRCSADVAMWQVFYCALIHACTITYAHKLGLVGTRGNLQIEQGSCWAVNATV